MLSSCWDSFVREWCADELRRLISAAAVWKQILSNGRMQPPQGAAMEPISSTSFNRLLAYKEGSFFFGVGKLGVRSWMASHGRRAIEIKRKSSPGWNWLKKRKAMQWYNLAVSLWVKLCENYFFKKTILFKQNCAFTKKNHTKEKFTKKTKRHLNKHFWNFSSD